MNSDIVLEDKKPSRNEEEDRVTEARVSVSGKPGAGGCNEESEEKARVLENEGCGEGDVKPSVSVGEKCAVDEESRVSEVKKEEDGSYVEQNDQSDLEDENSESKGEVYYTSLLSEFDDFVANEKNGAMEGTCRALSYGFDVGDMVWGKVKSHPWWPGHIFNEAFATTSVRRTRRAGHVLVAFFGDSSYGWFDPAELIPFDSNFAEKSQQTNSRNFVKAVEEAVDEANRRYGLALACKCRDRVNFRPANVQGYFAVDVPDYEPGGVYSESQIKKARDEFRPAEALAFVKQLAFAPHESDQNTMHFVKNKAIVFSLRKAVFEEYDETYAQAFGVQPSRSSNDTTKALDQPAKESTRAPLSGPLVIAETLGGEKSSKKHIKVKDHLKKDRYLFKRRDESGDSGTLKIGHRQASPSAPAVYVEDASGTGVGDYVLQKRAPAAVISKEIVEPREDVSGKSALNLDQAPGSRLTPTTEYPTFDAKPVLDKDKGAQQEAKGKAGPGSSDLSGKGVLPGVIEGTPSFQQGVAVGDVRHGETAKVSGSYEDSQDTEPSAKMEGDGVSDKLQESRPGLHVSPLEAKRSPGMVADGRVKKAKLLKRPLEQLSSDNSITGEKKKKKRKELGTETSTELQKKHLVTAKGGVAVGSSAGKSIQSGLVTKDDSRVHHQKKDGGTGKASSSGVGTLPRFDIGNIELELPQLLTNLQALALDPSLGVERNKPSIAVQFFLQFRALVYQKSLVLSPLPEIMPGEVRGTKAASVTGASDNSVGETARDLTPSRPVKSVLRSDDPTKAGRKRLPSDRQEEIAAKRLKKINQLKSLSAGKKLGQRILETQKAEGKESVSAPSQKTFKLDSIKKMELPARPEGKESASAPPLQKTFKLDSTKKTVFPARAVEPTMLVMKFPPKTSLPSVAELKARFARFGSIDLSAIRVFWKSSTCRVVFRHKSDALAAYKYAVRNNSLFPNMDVRYSLREAVVSAPEAPDFDKGRGDDMSVEAPLLKDPVVERAAPALAYQSYAPSALQPKSILKKSNGDEVGQMNGGNGGRGTPRVKFMLGGEETSRGEQMMVGNRNNFNNNASFADGGAPTSVAMEFNSKNFQKVIPPSSQPALLPLPPQFAKPPQPNNTYHTEAVVPRNVHNLNSNTPSSSPSADISQPMLSLLTRCNDVVTTVASLLGYVPYHPL